MVTYRVSTKDKSKKLAGGGGSSLLTLDLKEERQDSGMCNMHLQ